LSLLSGFFSGSFRENEIEKVKLRFGLLFTMCDNNADKNPLQRKEGRKSNKETTKKEKKENL